MGRARTDRRSRPSALLAAGLLLAAAAEVAPQDRFGETAEVVLVQIPVHVTHDGEPLKGLTARNFEILEGRRKQEIVAVDVFDLSLMPTGEAGAPLSLVPPAGRRYFTFLFDLSNSLPAGIVRARQAALDVVHRGLHPSDLVAVATYSQHQGAEVLMGFSTDRLQLRAVLEDLGLADPFERLNDPLRLSVIEQEELLQSYIGDEDVLRVGGAGFAELPDLKRDALTMMVQQLKDLSVMSSRANRDQVKQQIIDLSTHLDALAKLLDSASGRKQIVLFSQGFDSEIVFGTQDARRIQEIVDSVQFGQTWRVDSEERFGASDVQGSLLAMLERFNRSDCAIHAVDVGGLAAGGDAATFRAGGVEFGGAGPLDRGHDGLALMASETGGEFYRNFNDLSDAMRDLLDRTSVTYVVSFRPKEVAFDGSYRSIKVRLKGVPKGTRISHRPGYFARRSFSELDTMERQLLAAEQLVAGQAGGQVGTALLAAPFKSEGRTAHVLTAIEIEGSALTRGQQDNLVPAEVYTYAFDGRGRILDYFSQAIVVDLHKVGYRLGTGFKLLSHLDLPPGSFEIRSLVRNAHTGATGLALAKVEVPDFGRGDPFLLPPFFMEPEDRWVVGLEERADRATRRYPLMGGRAPMIPAAVPRLASGRPIPMLLVGFDLPAELEADARLVDSSGRERSRASVEIERRLADLGDGERLITSLRVGKIAPGHYDLVVVLRGDGHEITGSIPVSFLGRAGG